MNAAAISASFNGALSPDPAMAGTAVAAASRTVLALPLKAPRTLVGRHSFGTVSLASSRAAAGRVKEFNPLCIISV